MHLKMMKVSQKNQKKYAMVSNFLSLFYKFIKFLLIFFVIFFKDILNDKYNIVNLIENLGFALTSPTIELRVNGTKLLSNILKNLPLNYLNEQQLYFIVTFYCDRLKDHHNVIPAVIDGILALSKMNNLPIGSSEKLFRNFIQNTTCQSQVREDRLKIYQILELISEKYYDGKYSY